MVVVEKKESSFWSIFFKIFFVLLTFSIILMGVHYFMIQTEGSAGSNTDMSRMWKVFENTNINPLLLSAHERDVLGNLVLSDEIEETFDDIGGNLNIKDNIERLVIRPTLNPDIYTGRKLLRPPNGIILHGPPGTGKTMTARAVAKKVGVPFINVTSDMVENKFYGESQKMVHAIFSLANKVKPCVVFFDEIDGLCGTRNIFDQSHVTSVKTTLLGELDGIHKRDPGIIVFGATNRLDNLDPALKRRMRLHIEVGLPDKDAREAIINKVCKGEPLDDNVNMDKLAKKTEGMSGSDLHELCKLAAQHAMKEACATGNNDVISISKTNFKNAIEELCPTTRASA